jgi:hypothetical protein
MVANVHQGKQGTPAATLPAVTFNNKASCSANQQNYVQLHGCVSVVLLPVYCLCT